MSLPSTREELKDYCLRKLGFPVIQINVSQEQLEDRIDDSLEYFQQYHFDGVEQIYLKHKITASHLTFTGPTSTHSFDPHDTIEGNTSGALGTVIDLDVNTLGLRFVMVEGSPAQFQIGEQVFCQRTLNVVTIAPNGIVIGDLDNKWIPCEDSVLSVIRVMPLRSSPLNMFDVRYQFALNNMPNLLGMDVISYKMYNQHLALLHELFYGEKFVRHNKKMGRIYLDLDWKQDVAVDQYVILDAWRTLDPEEYTKVYGDYWVRMYTTSLFKKQWAQNMSKFKELELPGGVKLNAGELYDQATRELEDLEKRIHTEFQLPLDFGIA